jgi:hypothetical protein
LLRPAHATEELRAFGRVARYLEEASMANQLGKRFQCETCGTEVLCIKPGEGAVECCGAPMKLMQPKVLPSAD